MSPGWTIGCSVEVKIHEYKDTQQSYFIELFDIGGSISHQNTRSVFYNPTHGIILVHDLTNRKSHENLQRWLYEIINKDGKDIGRSASCDSDFDPEFFMGSTQVWIALFLFCFFFFFAQNFIKSSKYFVFIIHHSTNKFCEFLN